MDDKKISKDNKKPDFDNIAYKYDNICNDELPKLTDITKDDLNKISIPKKKVSFNRYTYNIYYDKQSPSVDICNIKNIPISKENRNMNCYNLIVNNKLIQINLSKMQASLLKEIK